MAASLPRVIKLPSNYFLENTDPNIVIGRVSQSESLVP